MGKDIEGKFHPREGEPSGSTNTASEVNQEDKELFEDNLDLKDRYTDGEDEPAPGLLRHPNRNTEKRSGRSTGSIESKTTKRNRDGKVGEPRAVKPASEISAVLTKEIFSELAATQAQHCISFYLQTRLKGSPSNETADTTTFKNYLQQIVTQLKQKDVDELEIENLLGPSYALLEDDQFWRGQSAGLAVFITQDSTQYMKLPAAPKQEELLVNTSYYLSPLIPVLTQTDYFYLLLLSKKESKLFRAGEFGIVELIIEEMPNGVDDVVHLEEKDDQKLFRTGSSGAGSGANYHGTGAGKPDDKENIAMYFDEVDKTVWKAVLNKENVPLLLAGVEYLIPIYKSVAKYKPIWDESITGNQQHTDLKSLHAQAKKIMEPYFGERNRKALALFGNQSGTELTSLEANEIIPAAHYKRIAHLFVQEGVHIWGTFDEQDNKLVVSETQTGADEDLIDKAVIRTILNAGEVHFLPKEQMPGKSDIAALMRY